MGYTLIGSTISASPDGIIALANNQIAATNGYIISLSTIASGLIAPMITPVFPAGPSAPALSTPALPAFSNIAWVSPDAPAAFTDVLDTSTLFPAPFDTSPPTIVFSPVPTAFSGSAPTSPGVNFNFADPTLTVSLPIPPSLLSLSVGTFGGVTLPTIDPNALVSLTAVAPSIREYTPGSKYTSTLLQALQTTLLTRITTGGTGLSPDVENAIWDRGREREAKSRSDALKDLDKMEFLGFTLPTGLYLDARLKVTTESDFVNRGLSREIMIKQAELEQENVKQALATATQLEGQLISYTNQVEQRLFDSTKYATEAGISIYNAQVQAYAAYVEGYKTKVQIYEAQVRGELAKVEVYKAQVDAEQVKASINTALVEQYKASANVAMINVEIYKAQIAAIQTKAEIEKTKIEAFGEQIKAYVAQINAYTAGVEGYRASLEAEKTKQQVYQSQVDAFSARVGAAAKQADVKIAQYQGRIAAKNIELEGYKAKISGEVAKVQAIAATNSTIADTFKIQVASISAFNDTQTKQWQVALDQSQRVAEIGVSAAKANGELYISARSLALDGAKVGAQVSAQLGAAALNAVNWSTSFSNSNSSSLSDSYSNGYSKSDSTSTAYNYNFSS